MENEGLSDAAREYDSLAIKLHHMLKQLAQGKTLESEDQILEKLDRLWRKMTREERARVDKMNRQALGMIDGNAG